MDILARGCPKLQSSLPDSEYSPEFSSVVKPCTFCFRAFTDDGFTYIDPEECNAFKICIKGCVPFGPPYPPTNPLVKRSSIKITLLGFDSKDGYFVVGAKEFNEKKIKIRGNHPASAKSAVVVKKTPSLSTVHQNPGVSKSVSSVLVSDHNIC
jgi:hypothetical protein